MSYVEGFVTPVPTAARDRYRAHAESAAPMFAEFGARRMVEAWGDDVPQGKLNDLPRAVALEEGETVVFSWIEYPDRAARDAANERILTDPRMEALGDCPFDASRMIFSGFESVIDEGKGRGGYIDGFVLPVSPERKESYVEVAAACATIFREHGALRVVEAWGDDVPAGERTDFLRAAHAKEGETIVFSWIEWRDKAARDAGMAAAMADPRMKAPPSGMPFDGARMIHGGFEALVDRQAG